VLAPQTPGAPFPFQFQSGVLHRRSSHVFSRLQKHEARRFLALRASLGFGIDVDA
jgi:hypothetical protein